MAASAYQQQVENIYLAYYGRPADPAGLTYWESQLSGANGNLNTIMTAFATSAEATTLYGSLNTTQQISAIYEALFNHAPDSAGLAYYLKGISTGAFTLASVALNVFNGASGTDATVLGLKQTYAAAFTAALAVSTADQALYNGTTAANNARGAVAGVTTAANETASVAALPTTLANIGSATVTYTLTTAVESIAPISNSLVVGVLGNGLTPATTSTFIVGDVIAATGVNNTLDLTDVSGATALPSTVATSTATTAATNVTVSGVQTVNLVSDGEVGTSNFAKLTGLTTLNVTANGGTSAAGVTAAGTTSIALTDTAQAPNGIVVNGGSTVGVTSAFDTTGTISVGQTTASTGAVTVTATDTVGAFPAPNVTVSSGGAVTINNTVDSTASSTAGAIKVNSAVGAVVVNAVNNANNTAAIIADADTVTVSGGSTITVNESVGALQTAAAISSVFEGNVAVNGDATTTTVTVTQAAANSTGALASGAVAAIAGVAGVTAVTAAPGIQGVSGVTAVTATAAIPASVGTPITADGTVTIVDKGHAITTTASNTITTVNLSNYGNSTFTGNALANLTLTGTSGTLSITNVAVTSAPVNGIATSTGLTNTTLNLTLNGLSTTLGNTITDVHNEITTLNVTTATGNSTLSAFVDTGLNTLNVSGSGVLTLGFVLTSLTTLTVTGAAGFNSSIAGSAVTVFDPSSSNAITTSLNATTQSFTGSTGTDIITISADATKVITGGTATNNEIILNNTAATFNATLANLTETNVTGFSILGVTSASTGTWNMLTLGSSINAIDVAATGNLTATFDLVKAGISLSLDATNTGTITYSTDDTSGANDSVTATIGTAGNSAVVALGGFTMQDGIGDGIATVNLVSNDSTLNAASNTVVGAGFVDAGLTTLNISGAAGLSFITSAYVDSATSLTINNTATNPNGVSFLGITDVSLSSLTLAGSNAISITTLTAVGLHTLTFNSSAATDVSTLSSPTGASLTMTNSGTGTATVGNGGTAGFADANLTSLNLNNNVAIGQNNGVAATATGATTGVTVLASTDNAHINLTLNGAASALATDTITLGNGNDQIGDGAVAGTVNLTVGTGSNLIVVASGGANATFAANITLGAHTATTGIDSIFVSAIGTNAGVNTIIGGAGGVNGVVAGDLINFTDASASGAVALVAGVVASVANGLTSAHALTGNHGLASFQFGGNTYLVEDLATGTLAASSTVIELTGTHTFGTATGGHVALAS